MVPLLHFYYPNVTKGPSPCLTYAYNKRNCLKMLRFDYGIIPLSQIVNYFSIS